MVGADRQGVCAVCPCRYDALDERRSGCGLYWRRRDARAARGLLSSMARQSGAAGVGLERASMTILRLSWKEWQRRPLRSAVTVAGVAVAIAALFSLLSLEHGYRQGVKNE